MLEVRSTEASKTGNNECPDYKEIDGDHKAELVHTIDHTHFTRTVKDTEARHLGINI